MFDGIPSIKEILSTPDEWHSLVTGFFHSFYRSRKPPEAYMEEVLSPEYHYYVCGRGLGHITKAVLFTAIAVLAWRHRK